MKINKRVGAAVTASALALGLLVSPPENMPLAVGSSVSAAERSADITSVHYSADSLPDSAELEEMYISRLFYGEGISLYADYGHNLTGTQRTLYDSLRSQIEAVAKGEATDTIFTVSRSAAIPAGSTDDEKQAIINGLSLTIGNDLEVVFRYLLVDLPEDFYWFNKLQGIQTTDANVEMSSTTATVIYIANHKNKPTELYRRGGVSLPVIQIVRLAP